MNRKLRCSKRQAMKINSKLFNDSAYSVLHKHRLTAREEQYIQKACRKYGGIILTAHEAAMHYMLGIPLLHEKVGTT